MESDQPTQQIPQPVVVDQIPQATSVETESSGGGKKKLLIIVGVLILLIVFAGGLIFLRNNQLFGESKSVQIVVSNTFDDLKNELESIDVGASESDLSEFDKDLNSL